MNLPPLKPITLAALIIVSFLLAAFGQPAWVWQNGVLAGAGAYALFWRALISFQNKRQRFFIAAAWFFAVQAVQLSWALMHPYSYIYFVYIVILTLLAIQFGVLGMFIEERRILGRMRSLMAL